MGEALLFEEGEPLPLWEKVAKAIWTRYVVEGRGQAASEVGFDIVDGWKVMYNTKIKGQPGLFLVRDH